MSAPKVYAQCKYVAARGSASDRRCTRHEGHRGMHNIQIKMLETYKNGCPVPPESDD